MSKWAEWIKERTPEYEVYVTYPMFTVVIDKVISYGKTFLEWGFGSGYTSIALANKTYEVQAFDIDKELVAFAENAKKQKHIDGRGKLEFTADISSLKKADVVFSVGLLEHKDDKNIIKLLKQQIEHANSAVVFAVPSENYPHKDFGDERLMSIKEWEDLLKPEFGDSLYELYYYCNRLCLIGVIKCQEKKTIRTKAEK